MLWTRLWYCWCWCWFWFGKNRQCIAMPKQNMILMLEKKIQIGFRCSKCFISKLLNNNVEKRKKPDWWWGKRRTELLEEGSSSLAIIFSINGWTTWKDWMCGGWFIYPFVSQLWDKNDVFYFYNKMSWYVMIYHDTSWFVWQK